MSENFKKCLFLKKRHLIKFEDFYNNHPAIYLPFVCYNFLLLSLLPSVYNSEEFFAIENSRIKLLQKLKLVIKILRVFINTTLNIDITLNEEKFDENIRILKESSITKDFLDPFLLPEFYMSDADVILYKKALSSYLPDGIEWDSSSDLIPCSKFLKEMVNSNTLSGVQIWGPPMWTVTHYACYVLDNHKTNDFESKEYMSSLSGVFDLFLPCGDCSYHYRDLNTNFNVPDIVKKELRDLQRPFPVTLPFLALEYAKQNKLFEFYSGLHYHCKPHSNYKEAFDFKYFENIYRNFWECGINTQVLST